ncbi:hypothetical protein Tco_1174670 [Tanacetum coccineum]
MFQGIVDIVVIEGLLMKKDIDETGHVMIEHEVGPLTQMQVGHSSQESIVRGLSGPRRSPPSGEVSRASLVVQAQLALIKIELNEFCMPVALVSPAYVQSDSL